VSEPTLDPAAFAHLLEITGGDLEFVDELIDTDLDDGLVQLEAMRQAADAADAAALVRPAHSLKSSSANVGATAVTEACRALESDGRAGIVPEFEARVGACERAFDAVRTALLAERAARREQGA
jgi:two-component system sensor histidine kinase/response regulator